MNIFSYTCNMEILQMIEMALGGATLIGLLKLFEFFAGKRKRRAEAKAIEIANTTNTYDSKKQYYTDAVDLWKEIAREERSHLSEQRTLMGVLRVEDLRKESVIVDLLGKNADLRESLAMCQWNKCIVHDCLDRRPKRNEDERLED